MIAAATAVGKGGVAGAATAVSTEMEGRVGCKATMAATTCEGAGHRACVCVRGVVYATSGAWEVRCVCVCSVRIVRECVCVRMLTFFFVWYYTLPRQRWERCKVTTLLVGGWSAFSAVKDNLK